LSEKLLKRVREETGGSREQPNITLLLTTTEKEEIIWKYGKYSFLLMGSW
jgi:hypothetical protein